MSFVLSERQTTKHSSKTHKLTKNILFGACFDLSLSPTGHNYVPCVYDYGPTGKLLEQLKKLLRFDGEHRIDFRRAL